jgi:hypothetical protein
MRSPTDPADVLPYVVVSTSASIRRWRYRAVQLLHRSGDASAAPIPTACFGGVGDSDRLVLAGLAAGHRAPTQEAAVPYDAE